MRRFRGLIAAGVAAALALSVSACGQGQGQAAKGEVIKVGTVYALVWTAWTETARAAKKDGVNVELVPFKSSADELLALQTGQIQMAAASLNTYASAMASADVPIKVVAGVTPGRSEVLVRQGSGITTWEDMRGRRAGLVRGSAEYFKLQLALANKGMTMSKDLEVTTVESAADLLLALRRGDVDVAVTYEPNSSQGVVEGFAEQPANLNKDLHTIAGIPSDILAHQDLIKERPADVQKIMNAYVRVWKSFNDKETWVDTTLDYQSGDRKLLLAAAKRMDPWWRLDERQHLDVTRAMAKYKVIPKDNSADIAKVFDYSFLAKATGQSPVELGKQP